MKRSHGGVTTFIMIVFVLGVFGGVLWMNSRPATPIAPVLPTQAMPTESVNVVAQLMSRNFGDQSTPLPTVIIPTRIPTREAAAAPNSAPSATPIEAAAVQVNGVDEVRSNAATPTLPPPTAEVAVQSVTREPENWRPPALIPPISRDPLGRDHYWFRRPVESNANNAVLFYYAYGSDGQEDNWKVHHGIDMPNDVGEAVRAAGSGTVLFASDGRQQGDEFDIFQNSRTYGSVVFVEHDFGYDGQTLYTLYAHLSAALVREGDVVEAGQVIGLVGNSGVVSGPHVHFEVRLDDTPFDDQAPRYGDTLNPILWMVPYVGHGVIAGRVMGADGELIDDVTITIRNWTTGLQHTTTTSYVFNDNVNDVNSDPIWQENFAVPDVPVGRYDVIVTIDGQRVVRQVEVREGTTSFVELRPPESTPEVDAEESGG